MTTQQPLVDPWTGATLSLSDFITPSTNKQGHSENISVRVIPSTSRLISEVIEGRTLPFQTRADLLRHAIKRELAWIGDLQGMHGDRLRNWLAILDLGGLEDSHKMIEEKYRWAQQRASELLALGSSDQARRLVWQLRSAVMSLPEDIREGYLIRLMRDFPESLLRGTPMSLQDFLAEDAL